MRAQSIHVDKFGIDPIKDLVASEIHNITSFTTHVVSEDDIGRSEILSLDYYGREDLGFAILEYNGIGHEFQLKPNQEIKIPARNSVLAIFNTKKPTQINTRKTSVRI